MCGHIIVKHGLGALRGKGPGRLFLEDQLTFADLYTVPVFQAVIDHALPVDKGAVTGAHVPDVEAALNSPDQFRVSLRNEAVREPRLLLGSRGLH